MIRKLVFDIETSNFFHDVGKADPALLDLSIVCVHHSDTDEYTSYTKEELPNLWPLIEKTDMLIGFNSDHFDIPLLDKYYPGELRSIKSLDILKEIKNSIGRRFKLDSLAQATLGEGKSADGIAAVRWWHEGKIDKVRKYCMDDVRITKELYEYALKNQKLIYQEMGKKVEIPLDTSDWEKAEEASITHTLPF